MDNSQASHGLLQWHGTTIIGVKKGGKTVIAGDGQVSMGNTVMKPNARKVRRLGDGGKVIAGFAGATALIPAARSSLMTPAQPEASAKAPWTRMTVGATLATGLD